MRALADNLIDVRLGSEADIRAPKDFVRFVPEADIDTSQIPLRFDLHQPLTTANEISSLER